MTCAMCGIDRIDDPDSHVCEYCDRRREARLRRWVGDETTDSILSKERKSKIVSKTQSPEDLIQRLRIHALQAAGTGPDDENFDPETLRLERDAAQAIENLWEENKALRNSLDALNPPLQF